MSEVHVCGTTDAQECVVSAIHQGCEAFRTVPTAASLLFSVCTSNHLRARWLSWRLNLSPFSSRSKSAGSMPLSLHYFYFDSRLITTYVRAFTYFYYTTINDDGYAKGTEITIISVSTYLTSQIGMSANSLKTSAWMLQVYSWIDFVSKGIQLERMVHPGKRFQSFAVWGKKLYVNVFVCDGNGITFTVWLPRVVDIRRGRISSCRI